MMTVHNPCFDGLVGASEGSGVSLSGPDSSPHSGFIFLKSGILSHTSALARITLVGTIPVSTLSTVESCLVAVMVDCSFARTSDDNLWPGDQSNGSGRAHIHEATKNAIFISSHFAGLMSFCSFLSCFDFFAFCQRSPT